MAKILVIEDDPLLADFLRAELQLRGHDVVHAEDGLSGHVVAARERPDLIVLDFQLPAADGATVLGRLRGNTLTASMPVVFLTGRSKAEVAMAVPSDPLVRILEKPPNMEALTAAAAELLGGVLPPNGSMA